MITAQKKFFAIALFGAAAVLFWRGIVTRNPTAKTAAVRPDSSADFRQEKPADPEGSAPRFDRNRFKNTDTPAGAVKAANTVATDIVVSVIKNPFQAIKNILPAAASIIPSANPDFTNKFPRTYDTRIIEESRRWNVDPRVIKQLLISESSLNPRARGRAGELGLAQFLPATWADIAPGRNPMNPDDAIWAAGKFIRRLLDVTDGTYEGALEAYNGGRGNWARGTVSDAAELYADKIIARSGIDDDAAEVMNEASP